MFWTKVSGLDNKILEKDGEEVTVFYQEKKSDKNSHHRKILTRKERKESLLAEWLPDHNQGGQLAVDIYDDEENNALVIESALAGIGPKDIDITVEPDLIVIRGEKKGRKSSSTRRYYYQECFWGKFFRTLVLPCPVQPDQVRANFKNGVLTVILPKAKERAENVKIEE